MRGRKKNLKMVVGEERNLEGEEFPILLSVL